MHIQEMLLLSSRILNSREDSRDIMQESFLSAFRNLKGLKSPDKFKPWLKRIVINNCLKKQNTRIYITGLDEADASQDEPENEYYRSIPSEVINREISRLPSGAKQILTMYLFEEYKHKEIAEMLNISESTSKSQYQRALKILKKNFIHIRHEWL